MTARVDGLIADIRKRWHAPAFDAPDCSGDILIFAHGHILRAFAMRWLGKTLRDGPTLLLEPGGVGILRYGS